MKKTVDICYEMMYNSIVNGNIHKNNEKNS